MAGSNILFFDFDGTLVDSMSRYLFYYNEYARSHNKPIIDYYEYQNLRKKPLNYVRKKLNFSLVEALFVSRLLKKQVYRNPSLVKPFPGISDLIKTLKEKGYVIYIISSNTKKNIQKILAHHKIADIDKIISTYRGFDKTFFLKKYLRKTKNLQHAFVISDEYKDIKVANKLHLISIAVNWGANHFEAGHSIKPDYILNSAEELLPVILQHQF